VTSLLLERFAICAPAHKAEDSERNQTISDLEKAHLVQLTHWCVRSVCLFSCGLFLEVFSIAHSCLGDALAIWANW